MTLLKDLPLCILFLELKQLSVFKILLFKELDILLLPKVNFYKLNPLYILIDMLENYDYFDYLAVLVVYFLELWKSSDLTF